jgi:hypothetical protein
MGILGLTLTLQNNALTYTQAAQCFINYHYQIAIRPTKFRRSSCYHFRFKIYIVIKVHVSKTHHVSFEPYIT